MRHIHRFFLTRKLDEGDSVSLEGDDSFHASSVLRLRPGDAIELADADGRVFASTITGSGDVVEVRAGKLRSHHGDDGRAGRNHGSRKSVFSLAVVQSLPSGRKMELIVEKLSELGVERLVPVITSGSVMDGEVSGKKQERWRRIARSAAAQSRRSRIMEIDSPLPLDRWLEGYTGPLVTLVTESQGLPLGDVADMLEGEVAMLVGPEAGFSQGEIARLRERGAILAGLGPLLLRTETAALVAAAIVMHRKGFIG